MNNNDLLEEGKIKFDNAAKKAVPETGELNVLYSFSSTTIRDRTG